MNGMDRSERLWMWWGREESPEFRQTLRRIAWRGLLITGVLGIVSSLVFVAAKVLVLGDSLIWMGWGTAPSGGRVQVADKVLIVALSGGLIAAAGRRCALGTARLVMAGAVLLAATASLAADLTQGGISIEYVTLMFVGAVIAIPYRPGQTILLGVGVGLLLYLAGTYGVQWVPGAWFVDTSQTTRHTIRIGILSLLMSGVSGLLYVNRYQQYRARREAEALHEEVAELEEAKSRFFANVSHELRTPLTVILGPLEDALNGRYGDVPEGLVEPLRAMKRQAERLHTLVNQLLRLSKLDEGRMDLDARPVDLDHFLQRMVSLFRSMADRQEVEVRVDAGDAATACADPEALKQIVSNLLSNALQHTPTGGLVRLRTRPADAPAGRPEGEDWVAVSVRDSGPGLDDEVRDELFERYVGAGGEETDAIDVSTGIGLAVVKELTERHGGTVAASSEPGFGTEITVRLPRRCSALPDADVAEDASDETPATEPVVEAGARPSPDVVPDAEAVSEEAISGEVSDEAVRGRPPGAAPQVLVVDDESEVRRYLTEVLTPRYEVRTASDGEEGLEAAREARPDLVISDVVMPERDGYGLCRALRADDRLRGVPIILLTVQNEQEDRLEGLREGADAYVGKPFHPEELRQRVENLIGIRQFLQQRAGGGTGSAGDGGATAGEGGDPSGDGAPREGEAARGESGGVARVGSESAFLQEVRGVVEEHVGNSSFGVEWLADEVDLSTRQLQRRLQEEAGLSAAAYIRALRLERAAELLESGEVTTVTDAASAVGYRDASYFSQLFKEAHGVSPSELK